MNKDLHSILLNCLLRYLLNSKTIRVIPSNRLILPSDVKVFEDVFNLYKAEYHSENVWFRHELLPTRYNFFCPACRPED